MGCSERQGLLDAWVAEHDRLCQALDEYEFEKRKVSTSAAHSACDLAREVLDEHERAHGCASNR